MNKTNNQTITVRFNQIGDSFVLSFLAVEIILVYLDVFLVYMRGIEHEDLRDVFDLTLESGLGNWFAALQTFLVGLTLLGITWLVKKKLPKDKSVYGWGLLSVFFLWMALDDAARIHERFGMFINDIVEGSETGLFSVLTDFPSWYWHISLGPIYVVIGVFMAVWLWNKLKGHGVLKFILTGLVAFGLAMLLDFIDGIDHIYAPIAMGRRWTVEEIRHVLRVLEEFTEMWATTSIWYGLFLYIDRAYSGLDVTIQINGEQ